MKDIVRTPLGLTGTVIGVKYVHLSTGIILLIPEELTSVLICRLVEPSQPETARLWVAYNSGLEAPLEPQLSAGHLTELGYVYEVLSFNILPAREQCFELPCAQVQETF